MSFCTRIMALFDLQIRTFSLLFFSIPYIETSAATGENVQLAVNLLLHRVMQRLKKYMRDIRYNYEEEVFIGHSAKNNFKTRNFRRSIWTKNLPPVHCAPKLRRSNPQSSFAVFCHQHFFIFKILFIVEFHFTTSNKNMKSRISKTKKQFLKPKKKNWNHRRFFGKI